MASPEPRSLVEVARIRAQVQKDTRAYTFLADGEHEGDTLTWGVLDQRSRAVAAALADAPPGGRALLLYPPGLDFITAFLGCLYAGVIAVPCYPPHPARPSRTLPRLAAVSRDAGADTVLTTAAIAGASPRLVRHLRELAAARWIATDLLDPALGAGWQEPLLEPSTIAFLQYTSGSTGTPKGVIVSHGNLLHNLAAAHARAQNDADSVGVSWLPSYHDMGLVEGLLQPLYGGYPAYLMAPTAFLQRPVRWLRAISGVRGTTSGGPNFAFELCVRRVTPEERKGLDLRSWRVAYSGAEPVRQETLEAFARTFAPCGFDRKAFYPSYGLAEATLVVSSGSRGRGPVTAEVDAASLGRDRVRPPSSPTARSEVLVGCGTPVENTHIVVVEPETGKPSPPDTVGEIWVASPSVAQGYWNRPEETARIFRAYLAHSGEGPFLRTGDLGFLHDGEVFITGRVKQVIIVRGRKHYPHDIELTVERSHPAIRPGCCMAFALPTPDGERPAIAAEVAPRQVERAPWRASVLHVAVTHAIREAVAAQHDLTLATVTLVEPGGLPKTSSGKLQRGAACAALLEGNLPILHRWDAEPRP